MTELLKNEASYSFANSTAAKQIALSALQALTAVSRLLSAVS